jgi:hypothetical protein
MLSININYNKISLFLLSTFPITILTGSFLVNLFSILLASLFLIYISTNKNIKLHLITINIKSYDINCNYKYYDFYHNKWLSCIREISSNGEPKIQKIIQ